MPDLVTVTLPASQALALSRIAQLVHHDHPMVMRAVSVALDRCHPNDLILGAAKMHAAMMGTLAHTIASTVSDPRD